MACVVVMYAVVQHHIYNVIFCVTGLVGSGDEEDGDDGERLLGTSRAGR
jgi:hypothetical protein